MAETTEVTVKTPSRLHFGIIDMRGDLGRIYCSVGVAIDRPKVVLQARKADDIVVSGSRADRVRRYAETILRQSNAERGSRLKILADIPEHVGLGSGTQIALATGVALSRLFDLNLSIEEIAEKLDRGKRSAIGLNAFKMGGFVLDGGHNVKNPHGVPPLIFRSEVPEDWFFVVGIPSLGKRMSGTTETAAFEQVPKPGKELVSEVSRIVLVQMIPALLDRDIEAFGEAITLVNFKLGDSWATVQGGRFGYRETEAGIDFLMKEGAFGAGQSSWGPTFYGLVKGGDKARQMVDALCAHFKKSGGGEAFCTGVNNKGAEIALDSKASRG